MATHMKDASFALRVEFDRMRSQGLPLSALALWRPDMADYALPPETIQQASSAIANSTRSDDTICPLTNRVLLLLLRDTGPEGAFAVADRIREELIRRNNGHHRWTVQQIPPVEQFRTADALAVAIIRMTGLDALAAA